MFQAFDPLRHGFQMSHIAEDLLAQGQGVAHFKTRSRVRFRPTKRIEIGDDDLRLADQVDVGLKDPRGFGFVMIDGQQGLKAIAATDFSGRFCPCPDIGAENIGASKVNLHRGQWDQEIR